MKQKFKYLIPIVILLALPWTHRLFTENMMMALPWIQREQAEYWMIGIPMLGGFFYALAHL